MAKYLDSDNGYLKQKTPISESSGSTDALKIVQTNENGVIDESLLPPSLLDEMFFITLIIGR